MSTPAAPTPERVVVKVGGGVLAARGPGGLDALGAELAAAAVGRRLLVVAGGGPFADAVRAADRQLGLAPSTSHAMALLAMEQLGLVLLERVPGAVPVRELEAGVPVVGRPGVLLAGAALADEADLPASWASGADTVALHVARRLRAPRLVLLKAAAGLHDRWPADGAPRPRLGPDDLADAQGPAAGVDAGFADGLRGWDGEAWVLDGREPGLLARALDGDAGPGTVLRDTG